MKSASTLRSIHLSIGLLPLALSVGLGMVSIAGAQTSAAAPHPKVSQGSGANDSDTRSLFLGTVAALVAQNVGSGVGVALSKGIGGSITRWFNGESATDQHAKAARPRTDSAGRPLAAAANTSKLHAGIAYEVHHIDGKGGSKPVDPARHQFRTGDRFQIYYRPALPGRVQVINVNPKGQKAKIDTVDVAAGELVALGPYQFVDAKGKETLDLVLEPCSTPKLLATTRSIVKVSIDAGEKNPAFQIRDCSDLRHDAMRLASRSIQKVSVQGSTSYALDRLSPKEIRSGNIASRSVRINLRHG